MTLPVIRIALRYFFFFFLDLTSHAELNIFQNRYDAIFYTIVIGTIFIIVYAL